MTMREEAEYDYFIVRAGLPGPDAHGTEDRRAAKVVGRQLYDLRPADNGG
jgi:hypothetical protein